jgi:K(+)-stimulated pyrophosphate-energized sodium pump
MYLSVVIVPPSPEASNLFGANASTVIGIGRSIGFVMGATFSLLVGQIGMRMAVQANVRVAAEARNSFGGALRIAYRAGTITGMLTDGLGLLGGTVIFMIFGLAAPDTLLGFGFGGTLLALFMRVGGGIFTKAADVGADLVGKVEAGIPEDDPRNPAVVADLVGDNVGDCAGMAADIFESYEVTIVSGLILGVALFNFTGHIEWIIYPLIVRGIGVLSSIIGTYAVRAGREGNSEKAMSAIFSGFLSSAAISAVLFFIAGFAYLNDGTLPGGWWRTPLAVGVGVLLAILIDRMTEFFTGTGKGPVEEIKKAANTGPATLILQGLANGYESSVWAVVVIAATIFSSIVIFGNVGGNPIENITFILYGVAMTGIGMLTLTGNNVAMDSFGPIADNANGIGEMSWSGTRDKKLLKAQQIMADLDAVGNTTKAITKGVAIGSAVIAAVALFGSFIVDVTRAQTTLGISPTIQEIGIRIDVPVVFVGMLIGGALPWLFSSFAIQAVSRAASLIVEECRRQFKLGVLKGRVKPDYRQAVGISTTAAQKELIPLALLGVITPILLGLLLGVNALGGFLAGIILSGQLLAVFMNNAGGAWDNAKKLIEDEPKNPAKNLGKGSERHKAGVVGDTVGDPMKDTAGPALNPMIKVVNLVSVIIAPVVVGVTSLGLPELAVAAVLVGILAWAIRTSKRTAPTLKQGRR